MTNTPVNAAAGTSDRKSQLTLRAGSVLSFDLEGGVSAATASPRR